MRETAEERQRREDALADAQAVATESRGWKGEGGAIAGKLRNVHACSPMAAGFKGSPEPPKNHWDFAIVISFTDITGCYGQHIPLVF